MYGSKYIHVAPGTIADTDLHHILKVGSTFGGVTVIAATVMPAAAGTLNVVLQNYGASGTVAGGTVAGISGGSAALVADTAVSLALTAANVFLDDGEWLVLKAVGGTFPANSSIVIEYVDGVVTQG